MFSSKATLEHGSCAYERDWRDGCPWFQEIPPGGTGSGKPVVVFIKDLSEEGVSAWGSDSNSDSGRGPSSEDGDPAGASGVASGPSAPRGGRAPPRSTDALHRSTFAMATTTTPPDVKRTSQSTVSNTRFIARFTIRGYPLNTSTK